MTDMPMKTARKAAMLVNFIKPILAGNEPEVQGAVLADLLAIWLAGHAPPVRETVLRAHICGMWDLIAINEKLIFGEGGWPGRKNG